MKTYPRLGKSALIERLRAHAKENGWVSNASLYAFDPIAKRSIPMHFPSMDAARIAAGVSGPPYKKPKNKTGPKPGSKIGFRPPIWSKERVLTELRRLQRAGKRTAPADLDPNLLHAAHTYAGGLRAAHKLAGLEPSPRRKRKKWWNEERVLSAIRTRAARGQSLATTRTPTRLYTAGRWHFGNWAKALEAAGIKPAEVKLSNKIYTKPEIIKRLRRAAAEGSDLTATTLAKEIKLESVRREFGTLHAALMAAGLKDRLVQRRHGLQKWSRERVIEVLRERARAKEYSLTPALKRVVQLYFGGAEPARQAAGVPSPLDLRRERKKEAEEIAYRPRR